MAVYNLNTGYYSFFKVGSNDSKSIRIHISTSLRTLLQSFNTNNKFVKRLLSTIPIKAAYIAYENVNFLDIDCDENGESVLTYVTPLEVSKRGGVYDIDTLFGMNTRRPCTFRREQTKPGRILLKLFDKADNKDVEEFATLLKSYNVASTILDSFKEVSGDLINKYYNVASYSGQPSDASTLHNSCMRHAHTNMYMDLYSKNPDTISLLILPDAYGKIKGRAIIWTLGSQKFIDRIYYDSFSTYTMFLKYCNAKKIKNISNRNSTFRIEVDLESFKVKLTNWKFMYYPYPDTLIYLNMDNGVLSVNNEVGIKNVMDRLYLKKLENIYPELANETVLNNTIDNIAQAIANGYSSLVSYSKSDLKIFKIQSTSGKGEALLYDNYSEQFIYLNAYNSYFVSRILTRTINNNLAPNYDCTSCTIVDSEGIAVRIGTIASTTIETSTTKYVSPVIFEAAGMFYDGQRRISIDIALGLRRTAVDIAYTYKPIMFNRRLLRSQSVLIDNNDESSAVPKNTYNTKFKGIYDFLYNKYKNKRERGISQLKGIPEDILLCLATCHRFSSKTDSKILSYVILREVRLEGANTPSTILKRYLQECYSELDNRQATIAYISQNCCEYATEDAIKSKLYEVAVTTDICSYTLYCTDDLFEYTVNTDILPKTHNNE